MLFRQILLLTCGALVVCGGLVVLLRVHWVPLLNHLPDASVFGRRRRTFAEDVREARENVTADTKKILLYTNFFGLVASTNSCIIFSKF